MGSRGKLSRRTQILSAFAVALVFGGGWLAVWKWSHIRLRYAIAKAGPELRAAMAKRASTLAVPDRVPAGWIPIDLALVSISVPAPIERIEAHGQTGVSIKTRDFQVYIGDLLAGRDIAEKARAGMSLRLLSNGRERHVGFVAYSQAAHLASSADFRWTHSLDEVLALQQLLFFKAMNGTVDTRLFSTPYATGMVTLSRQTSQPTGEIFDFLPVLAAANDERDWVNLWCRFPAQAGEREIPALLASIRFPKTRYGGSLEELARHIETIATQRVSESQPAQP